MRTRCLRFLVCTVPRSVAVSPPVSEKLLTRSIQCSTFSSTRPNSILAPTRGSCRFQKSNLKKSGLQWKSSIAMKMFLRTMTTGGTGQATGNVVDVEYQNGLPVISVVLPSRQERCLFTLHPLVTTIGQFVKDLKAEDSGIEEAGAYTVDGDRIAMNTRMEHLLKGPFRLQINGSSYTVHPPPAAEQTAVSAEETEIKRLLEYMYGTLQSGQDFSNHEQSISKRLEGLQAEIQPLEQLRCEIEAKAQSRTTFLMWGGLAYMALQFGILARLTWWEYSWDIMEPVTYFITYGTTILMYGYFLLTKQEYMYPDARDRQHLRFFHKTARRSEFDIVRYNELRDQISQANHDLQRVKDLSVVKEQSPTKDDV